MRGIVTGRQQGKTTTLIKEMAEHHDSVMLCASKKTAEHAEFHARHMYPEIRWADRFWVFLPNIGVRLRGVGKIYIDDLDLCLESMLGVQVEGVAVTGEMVDGDELDRQYLRDLLEEQQRG